MTKDYSDSLASITPMLCEAIRRHRGEQLESEPYLFDAVVQEAMRELGRLTAERVAAELATTAVESAKETGWRVERSPTITFWTVFGEVTVASPYLTSERQAGGRRPVNDLFGVRSSGRTTHLQRAICDFGIDESFEAAANKLKEHYGLVINRTAVLRIVEKHGAGVSAQASFEGMRARCGRPVEGPGLPHLVEMDGSAVRTGVLAPKEEGGVTAKRGLPARTRRTEWRDLRLAFIRRLDRDEATFVGRIDDFDNVIEELLAAACAMGWTPATFTLRVTDGGPGLREALDKRFPCGQHVLDKPHLLHHLHETSAAVHDDARIAKVIAEIVANRVSAGDVEAVVNELRAYQGEGAERVHTLAGYLARFADAVNYDEFQRLGYPIGSGEIESAHKGQVQARLKLPGSWWTVEGANNVLALRLLRTNGRWDAYWKAA